MNQLLSPYLKRGKSVDELIPWLYLKGISTGRCAGAGVQAGVSAEKRWRMLRF